MQNRSMNHEWCDVVFVRRVYELLLSRLGRVQSSKFEYDYDLIQDSSPSGTAKI